MKTYPTYLAVGAACLAAGGLAGVALNAPADSKNTAATVGAAVPEQVRTETVTRVIHRVRKVHLHPKRRAAAPAPAPAPAPAVAPAPVAPAPRVRTSLPVSIPVANSAPARSTRPTLHSRTSGGSAGTSGGGGEHEREGGGDD